MNNQANYNLILLIEDSVSSKVWKEEIEQLKEKVLHQEDFSSVQIYHFDKNKNEQLVVKSDNNEIVNVQESLKQKNNLVIIVSDVCSKIWHNNQVYETINNLSKKSLVSIVNILPKDMWRGLAVDSFLEVKSTLPVNIQNNSEIINKVPSYLDQEELDHIIIMPMIELHETDKLLNSVKNGGSIQTTYLYDDNLSLLIDNNQKPKTVKEQMKHYTARVFQPAVMLAQYFSEVESFTISDLEYVRKNMLPDTDKSTVAQFLLGGILDKEENNDNALIVSYPEAKSKNENYETRYKMKPGIADEFKRFTNNYDTDKVKLLLQQKAQPQQQSSHKLKI